MGRGRPLADLVLSDMGFKRKQALRAVEHLRLREVDPRPDLLLRAAISVLTP